MKNFIQNNYISIVILKFIIILISIANVYSFYSNNIQLFNDNIVSHSERFLIGRYIISLMAIHIVFEVISTINMVTYYSKKHKLINYFLGFISIIIALPLFYNFSDDFSYYSGKVSPLKFLFPLLYFVIGIIDFMIAGKKFDE